MVRHSRLYFGCDGEEGGRAYPPGGEGVLRRAGGSAGKPRRFHRGAELRPASSQAFRDQDLEDAWGWPWLRNFRFAHDLASAPDRWLAGELLYGGLAQFRALGEVFTTPASDRFIARSAAAAGVVGLLAGESIQMDVRESDLPPTSCGRCFPPIGAASASTA